MVITDKRHFISDEAIFYYVYRTSMEYRILLQDIVHYILKIEKILRRFLLTNLNWNVEFSKPFIDHISDYNVGLFCSYSKMCYLWTLMIKISHIREILNFLNYDYYLSVLVDVPSYSELIKLKIPLNIFRTKKILT